MSVKQRSLLFRVYFSEKLTVWGVLLAVATIDANALIAPKELNHDLFSLITKF